MSQSLQLLPVRAELLLPDLTFAVFSKDQQRCGGRVFVSVQPAAAAVDYLYVASFAARRTDANTNFRHSLSCSLPGGRGEILLHQPSVQPDSQTDSKAPDRHRFYFASGFLDLLSALIPFSSLVAVGLRRPEVIYERAAAVKKNFRAGATP